MNFKSKIKEVVSESVLEVTPFGKDKTNCFWIEVSSIQNVAKALLEKPELRMDWLENLFAMEVDGTIVVSYFVRSTQTESRCILRMSLPTAKIDKLKIPSVSESWPMALTYEKEIEDLVGLQFQGRPTETWSILPDGWEGYPLRKSYRFPKEVMGIQHLNRSKASDE